MSILLQYRLKNQALLLAEFLTYLPYIRFNSRLVDAALIAEEEGR